jgi:hypothetical protein
MTMNLGSFIKVLPLLFAVVWSTCTLADDSAARIRIVFDADDTLVRWVRPEESQTGPIVPEIGTLFNDHRYRILDGAPEFIQSLSKVPGAELSIFSMGESDRNDILFSLMRLPDGHTVYQAVHGRILSAEDATRKNGKDRKDLRKVHPDLENTLIVEDSNDSTLRDQRDNILWIGGKPERFSSTVEEEGSFEQFVVKRNRLAYARGMISRITKLMDKKRISLKQALREVQSGDTMNDISIYREGAALLHKENPNYRFTSALGQLPIGCIQDRIRALKASGVR